MILTYNEHHSCTYFLKNTEGRSDFFMGRKEDREEHEDDRIEQTGQLTLENEQESGAIHLLTCLLYTSVSGQTICGQDYLRPCRHHGGQFFGRTSGSLHVYRLFKEAYAGPERDRK